MHAIEAPCFEASYAIDCKSALKLYDCLVPKIQEFNLRCHKCRILREEAGLMEPPMPYSKQNQIKQYWQDKQVEADIENLQN